jgi:hypothetical protein
MAEGQSFRHGFGAYPGAQLGQCLREPRQVLGAGVRRDVDVAGCRDRSLLADGRERADDDVAWTNLSR